MDRSENKQNYFLYTLPEALVSVRLSLCDEEGVPPVFLL